MRELSFEECAAVSGAGRWGWLGSVGRFIRDVAAAVLGNELSGDDEEEEEEDDESEDVTLTWDPSNGEIVASGTAWGENENGEFEAGWFWTDSEGNTYFDMNMDGSVESVGYFTDDGTYWTEPVDGGPTTPEGPPN